MSFEKAHIGYLTRIDNWKLAIDHIKKDQIYPSEYDLNWPTQKILNRLKMGVRRSKGNLRKWSILWEDEQTMHHLLTYPNCHRTGNATDLKIAIKDVN